MTDPALAAALEQLLPAHLVRQRWFGAKDEGPPTVRVLSAEVVVPGPTDLVRVVAGTGTGVRYQLLLGIGGPPGSGEEPDGPDVVGWLELAGGRRFCTDALADPDLAIALLGVVAPGERVSSARPLGAEQSNSSIVYDERLVLKVLRRLSGPSPEVEITAALADEGFDRIAAPTAVWRAGGDDLAVLQRFLAGGVEGWALARTSLRDLLDRGGPPDEAGADMAPEAGRLGVVTAELHLAMAAAFGRRPATGAEWAAVVSQRIDGRSWPSDRAAALERLVGGVRSLSDGGAAIRVHGDLHLGQVMRTDDGWYVLDFEGEPTRPAEERRDRSSPLRDVAGMVRSLSYAAAVAWREHGDGADVESPAAWERRNREAFVSAYVERLQGSGLLPSDHAGVTALLALFELDKAYYEVHYERAHRPDWEAIPLAAVERLLSSAADAVTPPRSAGAALGGDS